MGGVKEGGVIYHYSRHWPFTVYGTIGTIIFVKIPPSFVKGRGLGGCIHHRALRYKAYPVLVEIPAFTLHVILSAVKNLVPTNHPLHFPNVILAALMSFAA